MKTYFTKNTIWWLVVWLVWGLSTPSKAQEMPTAKEKAYKAQIAREAQAARLAQQKERQAEIRQAVYIIIGTLLVVILTLVLSAVLVKKDKDGKVAVQRQSLDPVYRQMGDDSGFGGGDYFSSGGDRSGWDGGGFDF